MEQGQVEENSDAQSTVFESLIKEMEDRLRTTDDPPATEDTVACVISRVDNETRNVNRGKYEPHRVNIGPYYWNPSHRMEKEKKDLLHGILPGDQTQRREQLGRYLKEMKGLEGRARLYYNMTLSRRMTSEEFARMLLLDGMFLLSRFVPIAGNSGTEKSSDDTTVVRDVFFLMENQIPFFVLEEIHKLITVTDGGEDNKFFVVNNVARYVEKLVRHYGYVRRSKNLDYPQHPCHLLHLLYMYFRPTDKRRQRSATQTTIQITSTTEDKSTNTVRLARFRAATYYYVAGVRLRKLVLDGDEACSILDVELKRGTLHVPRLLIDDNTFRILGNMVALEKYNPQIGSHVTAYCLFMSQIASTENDVELLVRKGIIEHFLSSDGSVAMGFANLCKGVILDANDPDLNYLVQKQEALEELCRSEWRKSMAWLRHNKCNNFLMKLVVVAAVIAFICTVEQSVFSALSYAKGK